MRAASIPRFVPIAISEVPWSGTSGGSFVELESRFGSVFAHGRNRISLGVMHVGGRAQALLVHHHEVFGVYNLPEAPEPDAAGAAPTT